MWDREAKVTQPIVIEQSAPGITLVTLNRPDRLNAMSDELLTSLHEAFDGLRVDDSSRVVVLTGAGRGFCSGLDLRDHAQRMAHQEGDHARSAMVFQKHIADLVPKMRSLPQPVIAAVNGPAAGGGFALALASDIRIASETATFSSAFIRLGLSGCDIGVSWMLPRLIGAARAFDLMLTGRTVDAREAARIGLVSDVVPPEMILDAAMATADAIVAHSPFGVRMTKEVMWSQLEIGSLQAGIDLENRTQSLASSTEDFRGAVSGFGSDRP